MSGGTVRQIGRSAWCDRSSEETRTGAGRETEGAPGLEAELERVVPVQGEHIRHGTILALTPI